MTELGKQKKINSDFVIDILQIKVLFIVIDMPWIKLLLPSS